MNGARKRTASAVRRTRLRRILRRAREACALLWMRTATTFHRRMLLMTYPLQEGPIPVFSSSLPVRYATLTPADAAAYRRFRSPRDEAEARRRLERGDRCFVTWYGGRIIHECWVTTAPAAYVPYLDRDLRLAPGDVYYYGAYTDGAFRGRRLFIGCYSFMARTLQREGHRRSVALVAFENRASAAVLRRSGLAVAGRYSCLRLGRWQRHWRRPSPGCTLLPLARPGLAVPSPPEAGRPVAWT